MVRKGIAMGLVALFLISLMPVAMAADNYVYVTSTGLNIRKTADANGQILRCADNGERLTVLKTVGDWYYVKYNSVVSGYVLKKFVSSKKPGGAAKDDKSDSDKSSAASDEKLPDKVSGLGGAPATSKKGDKNSDVKKLQQALKIVGHYAGTCDGVFGDGTETAVKSFQKSRGLSQDGVAGPVTIKLLFGEEPEGGGSVTGDSAAGSGKNVEVLDWFKDRVSSIIPKGTIITIKDVRTGSTFRARHLFGANHMDAEPYTKEDTAKMKAIYGGSWSWDRRAILILCSGRVFAASMNGMPHGDEEIYDNNFDGQFCIHFINSKTHGTDKVDSDHQYCISVAARSSW